MRKLLKPIGTFKRSENGIHCFETWDGFDEDAIASLYLGIIWVSNYNFITTVFWIVLEVYRDQRLLNALRSSITDMTGPSIAQDPSRCPLLQSIYAETLRLRTEAYITRRFPHKDVILGDNWRIPRNKICLASTHPSHQDPEVWNTREGKYPLDTFWAERFLLYPDDENSGPLDPSYKARVQPKVSGQHNRPVPQDSYMPSFSLHGLSSSWIPYGGGPRACPGRHIAKKQILSTFISFIQRFDVEILSNEKTWQMDERSYGPGVQLPVGKVAFRMRKRLDKSDEASSAMEAP
ncbi:cytochrome P450 [Lojkania enalia]|uniref:Cytochrome P450 n=1 Tax=Lojkania enalia TaxID=147567 RepID=A0A9P4N163_9PLEO|nr:cytochrome P450 [Didymosphaeria enalia]